MSSEQDETQIEKTLTELNTNLITANSPQAKERIERLFGTFKDRLIKGLRLEGIKKYQKQTFILKDNFYHITTKDLLRLKV